MRAGGLGGALCAICLLVVLTGVPAASAQGDLSTLDLEQLMEVEVVTPSRRQEPLTQVAGAITVLDEEDIFRSGATSIPDILRMVPGVHVAQMDTDKWGVGIRGFNGILSNKHLVLVDGRPITSPTTAGVLWSGAIPVSIIKRVEVVRGTWTHLWGSESFTGVINIITKTAEETQGGQSVTLAGSSGIEQTLQYGGSMSDAGHYRGYVKGGSLNGDSISGDKEDKGSKDWLKKQFGVRADWENAFTDILSFQGDLSSSSIEDRAGGTPRIYDTLTRHDMSGYGQFTFNRATGLDSGINFRTSFTHETVSIGDLKGGTNTIDAEIEHAIEQNGIHRVTWGLGGRYFWDDIQSGDSVSIDDNRRSTTLVNGYAQDRLTLSENSLYLFLGTKLDYFGESNLEMQPTVRLLHTRENSEYWLAVSRAVRADNRMQRSGSYSLDYRGTMYAVNAPDNLMTEKLISYEAGYRNRVMPGVEYDLSLFINDYEDLITMAVDKAARTAYLSNDLKGTAYGMEAVLNWEAASWLDLRPSVAAVYQDAYGSPEIYIDEAHPEDGFGIEFKLQVMTKPMEDVGFDVLVGYLDGPTSHQLPGYFTLEAHASWRVSETVMLELIGKNLSEATEQYSSLRVGPSVDLRVTWDF